MKFDKLFLLILFFGIILSVSFVSANDLNNDTYNSMDESSQDELPLLSLEDGIESYYVDVNNGDDSNNGQSWNNSVKTFNRALDLAKDNDTIYLANGVYGDLENTKITIDKSITIIGFENTTFDGLYTNYIFTISGNAKVTFKNINFINAYKTQLESELSGDDEIEGIYGAALNIKNADVSLDNCSFIYNMVNYQLNVYEFTYGGAISNFGNLYISNSYFYGNAIGSMEDIFGYGGSIYNKGRTVVNSSKFVESNGNSYSYGGTIYNDGEMLIDSSVICNSYCFEESKGAAIFNNGNLTLTNSIIENNTVQRTDFNYIYGNIFNSGKLIAVGNIFRNNSAVYKQPNSQYFGTPTIYNVGDLNLSYNSFIDNVGFNGIYNDVFLNSGSSVCLDNNWWQTNDNPFNSNLVNYDLINSWIVLSLNPSYYSLNLYDSLNLTASWKLNNGESFDYVMPVYNITFISIIDGREIYSEQLFDKNASFFFNNTKNKGTYEVKAIVNSFSTTSIIDVGKLNSFINIKTDKSESYFNENIFVEIYLTSEYDNITGNVNVNLGNKYVRVINIKNGYGNITFSDLKSGNYTLKIDYGGNEDYAKSENETTFIVKKIPVNLVIDPIDDIKSNETVNLTVNLSGYEAEGMAYLYVNGEYKQLIYLNNGKTTFNLNYFSKGQYNLTVILPENDYHYSASDSILFNVEMSEVSMNVLARDIYAGDVEIITVELSSDNFNSNAILSVNGTNYTVFLKDKLTNITLYSLACGEYVVKVIFDGNDRFMKANASTSFSVVKKLSNLNVTIEKNNLTGNISVKTNSEKCSGLVGLYVNQRYYSAYLINGAVKFNVEFDKGTNYIYVFYGGDFSFEASSWNTTIGSPADFFLIGENITYFEHNEFNYTVSLYEENGIAMPNQFILIKFGDKTYNLTTNQNGTVYLLLNLNEGIYSINANYKNITINNTLIIKPILFNVAVNNLTFGQNESIIVEFEDNITGKVKFEFTNQNITVDIIGSKAICDLSKFNVGSYSVDIFYTNNFFNSTKVKKNFTIIKANPEFNIKFINNEVELTGNVIVNFSNNVSGSVEFVVDDNYYLIEISNGNAILNISGLSGGYHNLSLNYSGNENFNNFSYQTVFPVKYLVTDIQFIINNNSVYGDELDIVAKVNENAYGNITFSIANQTNICEVKNGLANWKISGINAGNYNITAKYEGSSLFKNQINKTSFTINKSNSTIILFVKEIYLGENIRIYAVLSPNATGNVSFSMEDYYSPRNKEIYNSSASWLISPLETGQYIIHAVYCGDSNYYSSSTTFLLNITQFRSVITIDVDDVTNRENVIFKVTLKTSNGNNINGMVTVQLGTKSYQFNVRNGKGSFNIGKLSPGEYSVSVVYDGDENYYKSSSETTFTVADYMLDSILTCNNVTKYYNNNVKFVFSLTNSKDKAISGETIFVTINGVKSSYITDEDGKVYLDTMNVFGKYEVYGLFNGSDSYYPSNASGTVEVLSTIESNDIIKLYNTGVQYFAIFHDINGNALANTQVMFKINNKAYYYTTLPNGIVRLNINFKPGVYSITAINPSTGEQKTNSITIYLQLMNNKDVTNYYGAKSTYKVRVYSIDGKPVGAGKVVTFKVNGKTYKVKTDNNGYSKVSLKLKAKQYVITAEFNGTKVSNKIIVKPVLTFKIKSLKKSKKTKFSAKLVSKKGKKLKGKKITFKIKGKKYKVKTNKKGIATLKIKLKLKKGKYKVYAIHSKSKIKKIIKVR